MGFVVYDVETTGLNKHFDQILEFAAVRTDADLNVSDTVEFRARLQPHVVPSPEALALTGCEFEDLVSPLRASHYEMVCQIHATLSSWTPSVFLGYHSISFDEEMLRHAFYQCLQHPIYLTNTQNNARADVLKFARAAAFLKPGILKVPVDSNGRGVFRLGPLARENGIIPRREHTAMSDVETTLALCRLMYDRAPELWSNFQQFAQKASVLAFIRDEDAFAIFEWFNGARDVHCVTYIGEYPKDGNVRYCLDLTCNLAALRRMTDDELATAMGGDRSPVLRIQVNKAPIIARLWELDARHFDGLTEDDACRTARSVRADPEFMSRLVRAAIAREREWPKLPYVETQLYGGAFIGAEDGAVCREFHSLPWAQRVACIERLKDERLRKLATRILYLEQPDLLDGVQRRAIDTHIAHRISGKIPNSPWLTIPQGLSAVDKVLASEPDESRHGSLRQYRAHFAERLAPA